MPRRDDYIFCLPAAGFWTLGNSRLRLCLAFSLLRIFGGERPNQKPAKLLESVHKIR